jgi:hypothetical protein
MPKRGLDTKSLLSSEERITWCRVWISLTFSEILIMAAVPRSREAVRVGSVSVFSWKTKQERRATISSGV